MIESGDWTKGLDTSIPNASRVYDCWLGGANNFAADREFANKIASLIPAKRFARENRAFLARVVRYLVAHGVRQFLDLGSGIPTVGNVHEIAHREAPDCRIVYVDNEPVAVSHSNNILEGNERAAVIEADLCDPKAVLDHEETRRLLDFNQPVAVLMLAVLHFVPDEANPKHVIATYRDALPRESWLAISHATADDAPAHLAHVIDEYKAKTTTPATLRSRREIESFFDGYTLVEPGLVYTPMWSPEPSVVTKDPHESLCYGGLAVRSTPDTGLQAASAAPPVPQRPRARLHAVDASES